MVAWGNCRLQDYYSSNIFRLLYGEFMLTMNFRLLYGEFMLTMRWTFAHTLQLVMANISNLDLQAMFTDPDPTDYTCFSLFRMRGNFMFWSAWQKLVCSLDDPRIKKLQLWKEKDFFGYKILKIFVIKTLYPDPDLSWHIMHIKVHKAVLKKIWKRLYSSARDIKIFKNNVLK